MTIDKTALIRELEEKAFKNTCDIGSDDLHPIIYLEDAISSINAMPDDVNSGKVTSIDYNGINYPSPAPSDERAYFGIRDAISGSVIGVDYDGTYFTEAQNTPDATRPAIPPSDEVVERALLAELQRQSREERDATHGYGTPQGRKTHWNHINVEQLAKVAIAAMPKQPVESSEICLPFEKWREEKGKWMLDNQRLALDSDFVERAERYAWDAMHKPVSVSLETCARTLIDMANRACAYNQLDETHMAKAVLDAAGVKYVE